MEIEEDGALAIRIGTADVTLPQCQRLSMQFTANRDPAQRNGFRNPILVFHAEFDSVNN